MSEGLRLGTPDAAEILLRDCATLWLGVDVQPYPEESCKIALIRKGAFTSIAASCKLKQSCCKSLQVACLEDQAVS